MRTSPRALRELLDDRDTFWVVLNHPELPLTNNSAERALRHWVMCLGPALRAVRVPAPYLPISPLPMPSCAMPSA